MRRTYLLVFLSVVLLAGNAVFAATMSSGFTYPTSATWSDNGNWLTAGCSEYQCDKYHIGRDISARQGDTVYAMGSGHIKNVSTSTSDAIQKYMWIEYDLDGPGHFYAVYGHVNTSKHYDDPVSAGDEIATIADYPPYGSYSGDHLHLGIRPDGVETNGWGRWSLPANWDGNKDNLDRRGFVAPWDYLSSHHPGGWCIAASVSWTSLPSQVWYRTDQRLTYSVGGTSPTVVETPGGTGNGEIWMSEAGASPPSGYHYHVRVTNGCNTNGSDIDWIGYWDNVAPTASRSGGASPNTWYNTPQSVNWSASDGNSGVRRQYYRWNGGGWNGASGSAALNEGKNTLEVLIEDNAFNGDGNQSGNTATVNLGEYWLDTVAPVTSLTGPATSHWFRTPQSVTWSATDATSGVATKTLTWDIGGATTASPAQIPEGRRSATILATDSAGNAASQTYGPWWIDTTPPVVGATFNPASPNGENGWFTTFPTISFSATDPNGASGSGVSGLFCALDGGAETPYTTPISVTNDGIHTYTARAMDVAGNSGSTSDIVKVDTSAPVFDTVYTDAESRSLDTLVAAWSCADPDSGIAEYEYWIGTTAGGNDVRTAASTASNWAYAMNLSLTQGQTYYFTIHAKNAAGLWSSTVNSAAISVVQGTRDVSPTLNAGGVSVEARASTNYKIVDSIGQFVVDGSSSANYVMEHGYWHSDISFVQVASAGAVKAQPNGVTLQIGTAENPLVVSSSTSAFADRFYIEQPDRSSGIAVQYGAAGGPTLVEGDQVTLVGKTDTVSGERIVKFASPQWIGHTDPVKPMFIIAPDLGGWDVNAYTLGVLDGRGLNNIGLLVKTFGGLVSYRDPQGRFFYVDNGDYLYDGSHVGVRVICDGFKGGGKLAMPAYGKYVMVTGISSTAVISGQTVRAVRPRRQSDIFSW